jgi:rod shape-determining protein MreC
MLAIKPIFATGPSLNTRLLIALIAAIALLVIEHRNHQLDGLRNRLSFVVDPLKYIVDLPTTLLAKTTASLSSYATLKKDNQRLREQALMQQARLLKFDALEQENIRLRALLENSFKLGEQVLIAELLAIKTTATEHLIVVNKGTHFGVHPQQAVVDANGVVGQVVRALPLTSDILLMTDPNHAIPVQVNRNGLLTIAVGSGQLNQLNLPFLPRNADIRAGDLLITSGMGGTFPPGYPVAVVDDFTAQANTAFVKLTATPTAQLDRNREVMIVWSDTRPLPLLTKPTPAQPQATGDE